MEDRLRALNRVLDPGTMEDTLGREVFDFMHPDSVGDARACIESVLATGNPGGR